MAEKVFKYKIQTDGTAVRELMSEVDSLRSKLEKATDPKEVKRLNDQFEKTSDRLKEVDKAAKSIDLGARFEDVYGDIQPLSGRLGELEDRMYELALAGKAGSDEFKVMQVEAANMRKTIIDVDRQVDLLAENKGMSVFSAGLGEVADSFMRLDFESAALQAGNLAKASSQISFGSAIKSLKNLGKTFASLGKALLTNPFFLIVAVVGAIVAAIVALMDELGILEDIFSAIGDAIGWVIQQFKDLLDWIGLTDYAAEDAAERQAEAAKKRADAQEKSTERIVAALDHEIRMMQADGEVTEEEFLRMIEAEKEKRKSLSETAKARLDEAEAAVKAALIKGDLDKEELADLRDTLNEAKANYIASRREIEAYDVEAEAQIQQRRDKEVQDYKASLKEKEAAEKEFQKNRLAAQRQIQDLSIELMEEGIDKEIAEEQTKYDRLIADTKTNETLTQEEKTRIVEQYEKIRQQKITKIQENAKAKRDAKIQSEIEADINKELEDEEWRIDRLRELKNTEVENDVLAIEQKYAEEIKLAKGNAELVALIEEEKNNKIKEIRDNALQEEIDNQRTAQQFAISQTSALFSQLGGLAEEGSAASKVFALASIVADTASALMKAVPVALEASKATGPAAPFIFAGTLAGIVGSVVAAAANAKQVLSSAPGPSASGGGGSVSAPSAPNIGQPQETPTMNFNDNDSQEQNAGGAVKRQEKVMVVDYFDIEEKGNEVTQLQQRVMLE